MQRFVQCGGFIALMLARYRRRQGRFVMNAIPSQGLNIGHGLLEHCTFFKRFAGKLDLLRRGCAFGHDCMKP